MIDLKEYLIEVDLKLMQVAGYPNGFKTGVWTDSPAPVKIYRLIDFCQRFIYGAESETKLMKLFSDTDNLDDNLDDWCEERNLDQESLPSEIFSEFGHHVNNLYDKEFMMGDAEESPYWNEIFIDSRTVPTLECHQIPFIRSVLKTYLDN